MASLAVGAAWVGSGLRDAGASAELHDSGGEEENAGGGSPVLEEGEGGACMSPDEWRNLGRRCVRRWKKFRDRRRSDRVARAECRERARLDWLRNHGISEDRIGTCLAAGEETMRQVYVPRPRWRRGRRGCGHCVACCGVPFELHWKAALSAAQWARERIRRASALKELARSCSLGKAPKCLPGSPAQGAPTLCELLGQEAPEPSPQGEEESTTPDRTHPAAHTLAPASPPRGGQGLRARRGARASDLCPPPKGTNIPPRMRTLVILAENVPPMQPVSDSPPSLPSLGGGKSSRAETGGPLEHPLVRAREEGGYGAGGTRGWGKWFRSWLYY